jgi:hypothetical protein
VFLNENNGNRSAEAGRSIQQSTGDQMAKNQEMSTYFFCGYEKENHSLGTGTEFFVNKELIYSKCKI